MLNKRMMALVLAMVLPVGLSLAACGSTEPASASNPPSSSQPATSSGNEEFPPTADVKLTKCSVEPTFKGPVADLTFKNNSPKLSNYIVSVEFLDKSGVRIDEGAAAPGNVAPGQVVKDRVQGLVAVTGKLECRITRVDRFSAEG